MHENLGVSVECKSIINRRAIRNECAGKRGVILNPDRRACWIIMYNEEGECNGNVKAISKHGSNVAGER